MEYKKIQTQPPRSITTQLPIKAIAQLASQLEWCRIITVLVDTLP